MIKTLFIVLLLLLVCLQPAHSQGKETDTRVVSYDSFFDLLNATGSVNPELYVYDFTDETRAHLGDKIFLHDIYNIPSGWSIYQELIGFYELIGRAPKGFAKAIICSSLTQDIPIHWDKQYAAIGYEMLLGRVMERDTLLGKEYLSKATHIGINDIDNYLRPFWRDSVCLKDYLSRHDSILQTYGKLWEDTCIQRVINDGDIQAYRMTMEKYIDGRMMILAIFMIDQYDYSSAYEDIYRCLRQCYDRHGIKIGEYGLMWIYHVLTTPAAYDVPQKLLQRIRSNIKDE